MFNDKDIKCINQHIEGFNKNDTVAACITCSYGNECVSENGTITYHLTILDKLTALGKFILPPPRKK